MQYNDLYLKEINDSLSLISIDKLNGKTLCLSGITGLIGSYLTDALLMKKDLDVKIIGLVRNKEKALERFDYFKNDKRLKLIEINLENNIKIKEKIDYVIHAASNTNPMQYSLYPIETMNTNYLGTKNMLDLAVSKNAKFMFLSSCEVYGKNETQLIKENDYGYVDILDPRACYNESKKASETLCICYKKEKNVDVVIPRLSRVYGPTMKLSDSKALSQFLTKGLNKEDIVLKSKGTQLFDYTYVSDVVRACLILLLNKNEHVAYNIAMGELLPLKDIANYVANLCGTKVVFDLPSEVEQKGYSKSLVSSLDNKLFIDEYKFKYEVNLEKGIKQTLNILK